MLSSFPHFHFFLLNERVSCFDCPQLHLISPHLWLQQKSFSNNAAAGEGQKPFIHFSCLFYFFFLLLLPTPLSLSLPFHTHHTKSILHGTFGGAWAPDWRRQPVKYVWRRQQGELLNRQSGRTLVCMQPGDDGRTDGQTDGHLRYSDSGLWMEMEKKRPV